MDRIDRRAFIATLAGAAALPSMVQAQYSAAKLPEVGFLYAGNAAASALRIAAFQQGLAARRYVDGRNVTVVSRSAESISDRAEPLARELVDRNVRVLFAAGPTVVRAAHAASKTIPIVAMDLESDPVKDGLVASIARPGGNVTGLFFDFPEFSAKWLELLVEAVPGLSRLAVLWDPAAGTVQLDEIAGQARTRGLALQVLKVEAPEGLAPAVAAAAGAGAQGLLLLSSPLFGTDPKVVADLALRHRLPAIMLYPEFAKVGGLMAYGVSLTDLFH